MNILITGANKGLGLALTAEALSRGHLVFAGMRAEEPEEIRELMTQFPRQLEIIKLDVTKEQQIAEAKDRLTQRIDCLDVLINNAAILVGRDQKLEELDIELLEQSMQTNLYGPLLMVKHFLPLLRKSGQPCILNIGSEAGSFAGAYGGDYPYALSKSALSYFTAQLHRELSPQGFITYNVHPGWMRTPMGGEQAPGDPRDSAAGLLDLAERKIIPSEQSRLIDFNGKRLPD